MEKAYDYLWDPPYSPGIFSLLKVLECSGVSSFYGIHIASKMWGKRSNPIDGGKKSYSLPVPKSKNR
jgi:hypothetical protein